MTFLDLARLALSGLLVGALVLLLVAFWNQERKNDRAD
jgi:hypothetical protein